MRIYDTCMILLLICFHIASQIAPTSQDIGCAAHDILPYFCWMKSAYMHQIHRQLLLSYNRPSTFSAILWANNINDVTHTLSDRSKEAIYILVFNIFKYLIIHETFLGTFCEFMKRSVRKWRVTLAWALSRTSDHSWHLHHSLYQIFPIQRMVISLTWKQFRNLYQRCDVQFNLQLFVLCQCIVSQNIYLFYAFQ